MDYSFLKPVISPSLGLTGGTDGLSSLASLLTKTSQTDSSSSTSAADFKDILALMLQSMSTSNNSLYNFGMGDSSEEDSGGLLGFSSSMFMMPLMIALMEKIMSLDAQDQVVKSNLSSIGHINQFEAEAGNGGDGINADCGPTSLVMALHALGLKVPGEDQANTNGDIINLARSAMVSDKARDGLDENGQYADGEHNTFTNFEDLIQGARASGATVTTLQANAASIRTALESGAKVLVSGTFTGKTPVPWTGDRGVDAATAPGFATDHIIAITGYDEKTGQFTVNDPARSKPFAIGSGTLMYFMEGNAGALALTA